MSSVVCERTNSATVAASSPCRVHGLAVLNFENKVKCWQRGRGPRIRAHGHPVRSARRGFAGNRLGDDFLKSVELILKLAAPGRVVVTGMGKAGLMGQKDRRPRSPRPARPPCSCIPPKRSTATWAWSPLRNMVLAVSNSGETEELLRLLPTFKHIRCRIVALTACADSSLRARGSRGAGHRQIEEPCPFRSARSTPSTAAMLALGDALALTVLRARGFTQEDYGRTHGSARWFRPGAELHR